MGWIFLVPFVAHWLEGHNERLFALNFILTIPVIFLVLSIASGWWGLSLSFKTERPLPENRRTGSAGFRYVVSYHNVLRLGSDAEGLYLASWVPLFHPRLFLPWSEIEIGKVRTILFHTGLTLKLGSANRVPVSIDIRTANRLLAARDGTPLEQPGNLTDGSQGRGFFRKLFP
jgi:hypothetical protein